MNDLSDFVNAAIKRRSWSMRELARRAGRSHASISDVLSGKSQATAEFCLDMARALDESHTFMLSLGSYWGASPVEIQNEEVNQMVRDLEAHPVQYQAMVSMLRGLHREIENTPLTIPTPNVTPNVEKSADGENCEQIGIEKCDLLEMFDRLFESRDMKIEGILERMPYLAAELERKRERRV